MSGSQALPGRAPDASPFVVVAATFGLVVGVAVALSAGAVVGCAFGSATAFGVLRLTSFARARGPTVSRGPIESVGRQIPAALDLLAACLSAGAALAQALAAVGAAFDGEVGTVLSAVARLAMLGAPIETAWSSCLNDRRWAPIARAVIRAHYSGAALTDVLVHLADDRRRGLRADAQIAAQRAGVKAVMPLGVCFLPAFVLVGVVPVVAGFAHALWR
ncbi:MAG TPA: type II secretion system F family protein [Acidothermaceae bacterium]